MPRRVLAAGLLSLSLVAACSDDPDRRSTALPPVQEETSTPDASLPTAAASAEADEAPTPVATGARTTASPAAAAAPAAPQKAQPRTPQPSQAAPEPASPPSPTRTATRAPAPAPTRSTSPAPAQDGQFALTIQDFAFSPRLLTVPIGSTVTATNKDEAVHDWTSNRGLWGSGDLEQGARFSFTFKDTGSFDYLCTIHPSMTGTVTVTPR